MDTIKIILNNAESQVQKLDEKLFKQLKEELMYTDTNAQYQYTNQLKQVGRIKSLIKRSPKNEVYPKQLRKAQFLLNKADKERKVFLMDDKGTFPTGLWPRVHEFLDEAGVEFKLFDHRYCPEKKVGIRQIKEFPELRYYQKEAVENFLESERGVIVSCTGCHAKGTKVLMHSGEIVNVEDVKVGDFLMGPDSQPRKVLELRRGREQMVKINPIKGEPWIVNLSHILSLKRTRRRKGDPHAGEIVNLSVRDYLEKNSTFKHLHKLYRVGVDFCNQTKDLRIPPRILGMWLGDGSSRQARITLSEDSLIEEVIDYCADSGFNYELSAGSNCMELQIYSQKGKGYKNGFQSHLRDLNLANNKHIPKEYLHGSREVRLQLLSGLLDTDGHLTKKGFEITTKFKKLNDDMLFLCRSLGLAAYSSEKYVKLEGWDEARLYYRIYISGHTDQIPTTVKEAGARKQVKNVLVTGFDVELLNEDDYYGFELDKDHLYLLEDFTVTHNSGKTLTICKIIKEIDKKCIVILPSLGILHNMYDTLSQYFHKDDICLLNAKTSTCSKVNVVNIDTFRNMDPELFKDCAVSIMDEFHHSASKTWQEVNVNHLKSCFFRLGTTATLFRTGGDDMALEGVLSDVTSSYTARQALKDGYLTPPEFHWVPISTEVKGNYQKQYKEGIVECEERNQAIADLCNNTYTTQQTLVLVKQINHLKILEELIPEAQTITGKEKDEERRYIMDQFRKGHIRVLIGTSVIGEGVDLPNAEVLVCAAGGKSKIQVMQNIGRVLRLSPGKSKAIIIDFQDASSYLLQHSLVREQIYNEEYY